MNLGTRAVLYTVRKWKKTLLVFCLLLAITTLVLSGLAINDAQEEQAEELRGVTGASFTVSANNGYTLNPVTDKMISDIAAIDGIETYNTSTWTIVNLYRTDDTLMEVMQTQGWIDIDCQFYGTGCFNSEYAPLFLSGALQLTKGHHVTGKGNEIILCENVAEKYGLSIGDTIEIKNGNEGDLRLSCKIAGLYEVVVDNTDEQATMARPSSFYNYEDYIFVSMDTMAKVLADYSASEGNGITSVDFFVSDAAELERIVQKVQSDTSIDWNSYYITVNNEVYERISDAVSDTGTLLTTLIAVITVVSMVLITLILSMSIRNRKREIGILLAIGIAKPVILLQYLLETFFIAIVALALAYPASRYVAGILGALFGRTAENIVVTSEHFVFVTVTGAILLVASVLVSCIPVMRYKPKTILSQID